METIIHVLTVLGYVALVLEAILVLAIVGLTIDYIRDERKKNKPRVDGKHRAPEQETVLERSKRELREAKEHDAWRDRFFDEYYKQGFYNAVEQVHRDDLVMTTFTEDI